MTLAIKPRLFHIKLLFLLVSLPFSRAFAQQYNGDVVFSNQSDINNWSSNWKTINGNLYISSLVTDQVSNLTPLQNLTQITGYLTVASNYMLTSLNGLQNITAVKGIEISDNTALLNVNGLVKLVTVNEFFVLLGNTSLTTLNGLNNSLSIAGDLSIKNNTKLTTCNATAICNYLTGHPSLPATNIVNNKSSCLTKASVVAACSGALPVNLVSFEAFKVEKSTILKWTTAEETNSGRFDVEESGNGKKWTTIGSKPAVITSREVRNYTFVDRTPEITQSGHNLYRLKMIDLDGSYSYSQIRSVMNNPPKSPSAFPNPIADKLFFEIEDWKNIETTQVFNSMGANIFESKLALTNGLEVKGWSSGIYIVKLTGKDGRIFQLKVFKN